MYYITRWSSTRRLYEDTTYIMFEHIACMVNCVIPDDTIIGLSIYWIKMDGDYYNNEYFVNIQQLQPVCGFCQRLMGTSHFVLYNGFNPTIPFSHTVQCFFSQVWELVLASLSLKIKLFIFYYHSFPVLDFQCKPQRSSCAIVLRGQLLIVMLRWKEQELQKQNILYYAIKFFTVFAVEFDWSH